MRIIAYTYEADVHCPACTKYRFGRLAWMGAPDECGVPESAVDRESNPVHPVFVTDEHDFTHCGTCRQAL